MPSYLTLLPFIFFLGCASASHIKPAPLTPVSIPTYAGKWIGTVDYGGIPAIVELTLIDAPYSNYEIKKNSNFADRSEVSGMLNISKESKRKDGDSCLALEERHWSLIGKRFGKKVFLYNIETDEGYPSKLNFFSFVLDGDTDTIKLKADHYIVGGPRKLATIDMVLKKN